MKKFQIEIEEISQRVEDIEANNLEEALEKVEDKYNAGEIVLDYEDFKDHEVREYRNCVREEDLVRDAIIDINFGQAIILEKEKETLQKENAKDRIKSLEKQVFDKEVHIGNLEAEIKSYNSKMETYANELRLISNSLSWKITKPLRYLSWMFSLKSKASFIDRILPPGSRKRIKYDEKVAKKLWEEKIAGYRNATDEETVEYWKGIEHRERLKKERDIQREAEGEFSEYEYWMKENDPTIEELELQRKTKFKKKPKISIVIPLYNTPEDLFRELLFNMYRQTYSNWELCLADGSVNRLEKIEEMCKDPRIHYKFLGENKGISGNSNEGLKMVTGDFVALLDHDDLLMKLLKLLMKNQMLDLYIQMKIK